MFELSRELRPIVLAIRVARQRFAPLNVLRDHEHRELLPACSEQCFTVC